MFLKCYAFTTVQVWAANLQEAVGLNYCLPWPRWLGRFWWEGTPGRAMGHHHWHRCTIALEVLAWRQYFCSEYYCMHWAMCTNDPKLIARLLSMKKSIRGSFYLNFEHYWAMPISYTWDSNVLDKNTHQWYLSICSTLPNSLIAIYPVLCIKYICTITYVYIHTNAAPPMQGRGRCVSSTCLNWQRGSPASQPWRGAPTPALFFGWEKSSKIGHVKIWQLDICREWQFLIIEWTHSFYV